MSNTRHSQDPCEFNQERYASSPAYERGLMANLFAKRCSVIDGAADRELLWFLQFKSHQKGGLQRLAEELIEKWPERNATKSIQAFGVKPGQVYTAQQMRAVRVELPSSRFEDGPERLEDCLSSCQNAASNLGQFLMEMCTNPANRFGHVYQLKECSPWYFPTLIETLREYQRLSAAQVRAKLVLTEVGRQVFETLDYSLQKNCVTLIIGLERIGKTHASKAWCAMRPGRARFVEVPSYNDDIGFFKAIAASLGVSINQNSKAQELRNRIEQALAPGDLMLVLDNGHYMWPSSYYRDAMPNRINWLMTALADKKIPASIVTTPQFFDSQKALKKRIAWRDAQFTGRIGLIQTLPERVTSEDLNAIARALLPSGGPQSISDLVDYGQASDRHVAGMVTVVERADFISKRAGREKILCADIDRAIKEVIPTERTLDEALFASQKSAAKAKPARSNILPIRPQESQDIIPAPARSVTPARACRPSEAMDVELPDSRQMQPA